MDNILIILGSALFAYTAYRSADSRFQKDTLVSVWVLLVGILLSL